MKKNKNENLSTKTNNIRNNNYFRNILTPLNNSRYNFDALKNYNFNMNIDDKYKLDVNDFLEKKKILMIGPLKESNKYYPYAEKDQEWKGNDIFAYNLQSLSLDYEKYIPFLHDNIKEIQYIFGIYSFCLKMILLVYGKEIKDEIIYEIYNHRSQGFTFNILCIIKQNMDIQPTFYFNYSKLYYGKYNNSTKKEYDYK